jgi:hypothetical protein
MILRGSKALGCAIFGLMTPSAFADTLSLSLPAIKYPALRILTVDVPEASAVAMLGIYLFAFAGLVLTMRKRVRQQ